MAGCKKSLFNLYDESKPLIPLKVVVFFFYGGIFSLLPYLSVHMQSLGLTIQQTAVVYAVLLLVSFAGSPIAGYLTDKTGRFKLVLSVLIITTAVLHTALLFIPPTSQAKQTSIMKFTCTKTGAYINMRSCQHPKPKCPVNIEHNATIDVSRCRYKCQTDEGEAPRNETANLCFGEKEEKCSQFNEKHLSSSNLTLAYFPQLYQSREMCVYRVHTVFLNSEEIKGMNCPGRKLMCRLDCDTTFTLTDLGEEASCVHVTGDLNVTFYSYFVLRLLCILTLSACYPLIEAAILVQSKKFDGEYGKQRVWAMVAGVVFTPLAGFLIDQMYHQTPGPTSYIPAFILFDVLLLLTIFVVVYSLDINLQPQPKLQCNHLRKLIHMWGTILLFCAVFFLGALWGFLETFLFVFLKNLGASNLCLGLSRTVGSLVCIPTLFFADAIMNKLGRVNLLTAAFVCYAIQMLCYSIIDDPWWAVALEIFKLFTSGLKLASAVTLANSFTPKGLTTTMQAIIRCLNYEIGSGVGNLVGGSVAASLGMRTSFKALGVTSCVIGLIYAVGHFTMGTKRSPCYKAPERDPSEAVNEGEPPPLETNM